MFKKYFAVSVFVAASVFLVCSFFYINAERLIKYESKTVKHDTEQSFADALVSVAGVPEDIPLSEKYRMYMESNCIIIRDNDGNTVYKTEITDISAFTEKDIKQLETDGIVYTARSELIEVLNYILS